MAVFGDLAVELKAITANAVEKAQQQEFLRSLRDHPAETLALVQIVSQWGDRAPTLPPGAIMGLAHAGIGPDHPVGQSVIRNGVPALSQPQGAYERASAALGPAGPVGPEPAPPINPLNPDYGPVGPGGPPEAGGTNIAPPSADLPDVAGGIGDALSNLNTAARFNRGAAINDTGNAIHAVQTGIPNQLFSQAQSTASGGQQSPQEVQSMGLLNPDSAKSLVREAGVIGNTGLQATTVPLKLAAAATSTYVRGRPQGGDYQFPFTNATLHVGSMSDAVNPEQFTLYQQLHGKDVGSGYLPAGPATAAATAAQQQAGNINGHALTYGRVLASAVTEPGTRPHSIFSGLVDAGVAMNLDPMANALKFGSESLAAAKEFAPLTDQAASSVAHYLVDNAHTGEQITALSDLSGSDDLVAGLARRAQEDPGRLASVAQQIGINPKGLHRAAAGPQSGIFIGLRPFVHKQTAIQWMSSKQGAGVIDRLASDGSFTSIRSLLGKDVPVDVIAGLSRADNPDAIRAALTSELGASVAGLVRPDRMMRTAAYQDAFGGYKAFRPPEDLRLLSQMPKGPIDLTNSQQMVDQAEKQLVLMKIPRDQWDDVLRPLAEAKNASEAKNAYVDRLGNVMADKLAQGGMPPAQVRIMTRRWQVENDQQQMFNVNAIGQPARMAGMSLDGEPQLIVGPHLEGELARVVPPLDYRELRQATQRSRQLLHFWSDGYVTAAEGFAGGVSRVAHSLARTESYLSGALTGLFKTFVLSAPRVPVRFLADEQAAMASAGIDSMFRNPLSYMAVVAGKKASRDITGTAFADFIGDSSSEYASALGAAARKVPSPWSAEQQLLKEYVHYSKKDPEYIRGWIDELSQLHLDAPSREVARAMLDPTHVPAGVEGLQGMDAVNEWFANGSGNKYLENLRSADLDWGSKYLNNRAVSEAYIQSLVERNIVKSGGDQRLLESIADGKVFNIRKANQSVEKSVDHEFRHYLGDVKDDIGPEKVKARLKSSARASHTGVIEYVGDRMLGALMDFPARTLTRSPAFRQWYYDDIKRMLPHLTEEAQLAAIRNAAEDSMTLKPIASHGLMELEDIDKVAKARSLAKMHDYLYYPGEKNTAEDILRNVMPFAPAWHSVIKRWTKLAVEHPQIVRHAQQGIQSLQGSGFFHPSGDPSKPGDLFTMAGPGIMKSLTGADGFAMEGQVKGLNIVGNGLPGVGVGLQMLASAALPKTPMTQSIRDFINPYGDPDMSGGFVESLFPGAFQKLRAGGYTKIGNFGWDPTKRQEVTVLDLAKRVFSTAVSSGRYDLTDLHVRQKLYDQSLAQAQRLYLWRGLAQFVVPSAPDYTATATLKDGRAIALWKMSKDYSDMLKKDKGDGDKASLEFVTKYGPNAIFATEPLNLRTVYGAPTSTSGLLWKSEHSDFAKTYPQVYGYFIPHDDKRGPYQNYLDAIKSGDILPLTVSQWAQLADQHLGNAIYSELRKKLGPSLNKEQRAWLANAKLKIQTQYPGFNIELGLPNRATTQERITSLYGLPGEPGALEDPSVKDTPLARTAMTYLRARDQALRAAGKNPVSGTFSAKSMAASREWLFNIGTDLAAKHPEFVPMWNFLLQPEVNSGN